MKDSVLDVLKYLFAHYFDGEFALAPDRASVTSDLAQMGFDDVAVEKAFGWLEGLHGHAGDALLPRLAAGRSVRVFADDEQDRLDLGARGYLLMLEQAEVLDADQRELVIDRIMALESEEVDLEQVRWVVRMVLHSRPDHDLQGHWIEGLALDQAAGQLH
jgi:Smg protein